MDSPEVIFYGDVVPIHEHVYENGFICLSILYDEWTPALTVNSVVLSIVSMLSSAKEKKEPVNNRGSKLRYQGVSPKSLNWVFEDDKC